jgi:ubiquinone/menaquinone biosynthesis C-methylase UbiE
MRNKETSWESSGQWYNSLVGEEGHFYHQEVILPNVLRLLNMKEGDSLLDLACGQGILARVLPKGCTYHGVDLSPSLIHTAKQMVKRKGCAFTIADVCAPLPLSTQELFTDAAMILAAQNIERPEFAFKEAYRYLQTDGSFILVINHPCFRIPRQSHWGVDESKKLQYRRVDSYMSSLNIPIQTHPGKGRSSEQTVSFHHPLSSFVQWLHKAGFLIETIEEWVSNKKSEGSCAKMENRARNEFPLFLAILAKKKPFFIE